MASSSRSSKSSTVEIWTSPTRVPKSLQCPASYEYYRKWKLKEKYRESNTGLVVHQYLEEQESPVGEDSLVLLFYDKLLKLADMLALDILETEIEEIWEIAPGIWMHRIVDALAYSRNLHQKILIDWKTAYKKWAVLAGESDLLVSPRAIGFQASGYMIPAPGVEDWPEKLIFLVAPVRGRSQHFEYDRDVKDETNYMNSLDFMQGMVTVGNMPKNKGDHCSWCDFQPKCYNVLGSEDMYARKTRRDRGRKRKG